MDFAYAQILWNLPKLLLSFPFGKNILEPWFVLEPLEAGDTGLVAHDNIA